MFEMMRGITPSYIGTRCDSSLKGGCANDCYRPRGRAQRGRSIARGRRDLDEHFVTELGRREATII